MMQPEVSWEIQQPFYCQGTDPFKLVSIQGCFPGYNHYLNVVAEISLIAVDDFGLLMDLLHNLYVDSIHDKVQKYRSDYFLLSSIQSGFFFLELLFILRKVKNCLIYFLNIKKRSVEIDSSIYSVFSQIINVQRFIHFFKKRFTSERFFK